MNGENILITGGFGNLGSWITNYLAKQEYNIYILTRKETDRIEGIDYKVIECDITNLKELKSKLSFNIDYCIHCASFNEFFLPDYPKKALNINALGTRNLLEVLSKKKIKNFIYFSTFHIYGSNSGVITEKTPTNPKNDYASTHLFAEYYVKQFGFSHNLKYTILRLTNGYGTPIFKNTDKWYLVLNNLVKSAFEKNKIILNSNGKSKRDFIYMLDIAVIVYKVLITKATNEIYNLSSNKTYTIMELAIIIKRCYETRYRKPIDIKINSDDKTVYENLSVNNNKLKSIISFDTNDMLIDEVNSIFNLLESI